MNNEKFYELVRNAELGKTECPRCGIAIMHHKDNKIKFCGICDYKFRKEELNE